MKKYLFLDRGLMNPRQMSNAKLNLEKIRKDKTVFFQRRLFFGAVQKMGGQI